MRLPFIQCDISTGGVSRFVDPAAIGKVEGLPLNRDGCYRVSFYGIYSGVLGVKTLPNVHNEPELRDWIDFHIRGIRGNDKA